MIKFLMAFQYFSEPSITDWIQAIASVVGTLFAILGFLLLINDNKDMKTQIKALNDLAELSRKELDAKRSNERPHFIPVSTDWNIQIANHALIYRFTNNGKGPGLNLRFTANTIGLSLEVISNESPSLIHQGKWIEFHVSAVDKISNLSGRIIDLALTYSDGYGYSYSCSFQRDGNGKLFNHQEQPYQV